MLNFIKWGLVEYWEIKYIQNDIFGIQVNYLWNKVEGDFFLYPYIDDNKKTIFYFAFDNINQKVFFENCLKISWVGSKTAFQISAIDYQEMKKAIENTDFKFFEKIPWIWPKSAKKILIELKWSITKNDMEKIDIDEKLYKQILGWLRSFGYEATRIKEVLKDYDWDIRQDNISDVIKWVVGKL